MIRLYDQFFADYATAFFSKTPDQLEGLTELMEEQNKVFTRFVTEQLLEQGIAAGKSNEVALIQERTQMTHLDGLNRLATLKAVQVAATQTFKLQEKTPPRLFIVLPKTTNEPVHVQRDLKASDFRFYFLCGHGPHIHLAQHEGYDLLRPDEFFSTYGSYLLTMLKMVKHGVVFENFVVPSLMTFRLLDGTKDVKGHGITKANIQFKVDEAIDFLQCQLSCDQDAGDKGKKPIKYQSLSVAELLRLESFLTKEDQGRRLGNLCRSVSRDDVVEWVCSNHSPHTWIEENITTAIKRNERPRFKCCSPAEIAHLCDVLEGTPLGLKALDISVPWKVSEDNIQSLCDAILAAGVTSVAFQGVVFSSLAEDAAVRGDPLKPILQLQSAVGNPQFTLTGRQLLSSIQEHDKSPISGLRKLNVADVGDFPTLMRRKLSFFLQRLPNLTEINLNIENLMQGYMFLLEHQHHLPLLSTVTLSPGYDEEEAIYYPQLKTLKLPELGTQFDEIIKRDKTLAKIIVPFCDDFAMCDIRALDPMYRHRQTPLVAEFVNDQGTVVEVEYRSRDEASTAKVPVGRLRCIGEQSVMYLRVFCDRYLAAPHMVHYITPNIRWLLSSEADMDLPPNYSKTTLDFKTLNLFGVPAVLEALSVTETDSLRLITCPMHIDLRWLALTRLRALSWSKLSRLEVRGDRLADWMQRFPFIFRRESMGSLREFCISSAGQLLPSRCADWIEAMVKSHPSQVPLQTIMLHDVNIDQEQWKSLSATIDLSGAKTLDFTGSSLQRIHFETIDREDLLSKLRIKAKNAMILF
ncbi:hypothetical protein BGZ65_004625 [Modicella reniformis]|uniref:Uncharacterized protein n=1 Tax=Modicella reniformis TaxID=1440133 RepID=A0A9P6J074_9FUNG|nr:hypothetical protein BGZ65_004625 [Modicella reniformis]